MSTFEDFQRMISSLQKLVQSGELDRHAQSICRWDATQHDQLIAGASNQLLEAHTRLALIDPFFKSLGWNLTASPDVCFFNQVSAAIEVPVTPNAERRWMDYLGFQQDGSRQHAKLMIEAKRYKLSLPIQDFNSTPERHLFATMIRDFANNVSTGGITNEWRKYLNDHLEYIRGLLKNDVRIEVSAITNGSWLVVISAPHTLLEKSTSAEAEILCFDDLNIIRSYADRIYARLSRHTLCRGSDILSIDDVPDIVDPANVAGLSYASIVTYDETPGPFKRRPSVNVAPLVGIIGRNDSVILCRAESDDDYNAPLSNDDWDVLRKEQGGIAKRICQRFQTQWPSLSISELASRHVPVKLELGKYSGSTKKWRFLTGDRSWIFECSMTAKCIAHEFRPTEAWHDLQLSGKQPSVRPRTMFPAGHWSHCRHLEVKDIRHRKPFDLNQRNRFAQERLCLVHDLEQYGCCQNCIYLKNCPATDKVQLPCNTNGLIKLEQIRAT